MNEKILNPYQAKLLVRRYRCHWRKFQKMCNLVDGGYRETEVNECIRLLAYNKGLKNEKHTDTTHQ